MIALDSIKTQRTNKCHSGVCRQENAGRGGLHAQTLRPSLRFRVALLFEADAGTGVDGEALGRELGFRSGSTRLAGLKAHPTDRHHCVSTGLRRHLLSIAAWNRSL
jgi:hypothetical protein